MNKSYFNSSPEEKRKQDEDIYQKFIVLGIIPLAIYLIWPMMFGSENLEAQTEIVEERIESVEENVQERELNIDESTLIRGANTATPAVAPSMATRPTTPKKPSTVNRVQPSTIKKSPVAPKQEGTFTLTYNSGDKIEYIVQPQNTGWKGVVQSKQSGNYRVKITEVLLANDGQQYLTTNNACNGGRPIGKNAENQIITVPGSCIHLK